MQSAENCRRRVLALNPNTNADKDPSIPPPTNKQRTMLLFKYATKLKSSISSNTKNDCTGRSN